MSTNEDLDSECSSCGEEETPESKCPKSKRPCGHHCNHSWSHDECCWCEKVFGEQDPADDNRHWKETEGYDPDNRGPL